jgi:uncharacterized protein
MPNQLIHETSPYLLQHANNPVDWFPWGPEALDKARSENKVIFLSIGYAACHWCHVMEHESFEDPSIAAILNEHFVSIKVDREERPDLDSIYMNAVVTMTGQGGWPMSVFLTPQGEPFYGGTYYPPIRRFGMPSFREVLGAVSKAWQNERSDLQKTAQQLTQHLIQANSWEAQGVVAGGVLRPNVPEQATQALLNTYDWNMGGWGHAPRFPQAMTLEYLLLQATRDVPKALDAAVHNLAIMNRGGLYDVVGGGFHRYSVDDHWLVPHFEKMLYDNAQLALVYLHAYLLTGQEGFRRTCTETLDFILREMTHTEGGFYSSLDADSEGVEGKYYVWTPEELAQALSDDERGLFEQVYSITAEGNFEGKNIPQRKKDPEMLASDLGMTETELFDQLTQIHAKLYEVREQRVRPATDDKVLVSWNALALRAFAEAARYLNREDYLEAARKNAAFLMRAMYRGGRLLRAWRAGEARHNGFLEDYAGLIQGLLALYQTDPNLHWYQSAQKLGEDMLANFRDPSGGFFDTRQDHDALITRPKDIQDNATPSGNALAAGALLLLAAFEERGEYRAISEDMLATLQDLMVRHPTAFGQWLQNLDFTVGPVKQIALVGGHAAPETEQMRQYIWRRFRPRTVLAAVEEEGTAGLPGLLRDRGLIQGKPTVYICQGFTCNLPVNDLEGLQQQLD